MNPEVEGYSAAVHEDAAGEMRRLAADLVAIHRAVTDNRELHAAITDTAVPAPARRAVLAELLEGKVSAPARRIAAFAAGAVSAPEVPGALEWLALRAEIASEGIVEPLPLLSGLAARRRVGGYAAAVFEDAGTPQLEEIEDQLFRFARTVEANPELRVALSDRDQPIEVRWGIITDLLDGKVDAVTLRLVRFVVVGGRPRDFVGTLDWLVEQTANARGWRVALVRAAADLEADQGERLSSTLATVAGAPVELQVTVDPALLSGAVIEIGDLRVDASARGRLERLREHLQPTAWLERGGQD